MTKKPRLFFPCPTTTVGRGTWVLSLHASGMKSGTGKIAWNFLGTTLSVQCSSLGEETKDHSFQYFLVLCCPSSELFALSSSVWKLQQVLSSASTGDSHDLNYTIFLTTLAAGEKSTICKGRICAALWMVHSLYVVSIEHLKCCVSVFSVVFLLGSSFFQDETRWIQFPLGFIETVLTVEAKINCI